MARRGWQAASLLLLAACAQADPAAPVADTLAAKIPLQGTTATLDIGTWNLAWFGDPARGPTDDARQLALARSVIRGMALDLLGLQEIVTVAAFDELRRSLPDHAGIVANDPAVEGGAAAYGASEQKVALLYRRAAATLVRARIVLGHAAVDFAGRPPLECVLRVTVGGVTRDLVVLVLHMKAFSDEDSWQRRATAADSLLAYLDRTWPNEEVAVIGDWNDDLDVSITPRRPSPYNGLQLNPSKYAFPTVALTVTRVPTLLGFADPVDHHLVTNELMARYIPASARAVRLEQLIPDYARIVSDHLPVVTSYR